MTWRVFTVSLTVLLSLTACVSQTPMPPGQGMLHSSYPIRQLNGEPASPTIRRGAFRVWIPEGPQQFTVRYPTLSGDYDCRFELDVVAGQRYDILHRTLPEPLVVFQWHEQTDLWARRSDPVLPYECEWLSR